MEPQEYLEKKLKHCAHYELTPSDRKILDERGLKDFLFGQITRKRFRRWKLPDLARERIDKALDHCLATQEPLLFRFRFGGYKLWRLESSPEADWAEFFALAHYSAYLAPVIAAYKPGVKIFFMSDDVFVQRLDNVPQTDTESYYRSFQHLCREFKKYAPANFSLEMKRHSSLYVSPEELEKEFAAKMDEIENGWAGKLTPERRESALATSTLNVKWDGVEDLTALSPEEKSKKIERSAIMHDALVQLSTIRAFSDQNPAMISIFTTQFPSVVAVGTTKTSIVKFWIGTGVLEERDGEYFDRILSPGQIVKLRNHAFKQADINLLPLKNFSKIKIYKEKLEFRA